MKVVFDRVQCQFPELVGHEHRYTVKELLEFIQGHLVSLVTLIENVLNLWKPPVQETC